MKIRQSDYDKLQALLQETVKRYAINPYSSYSMTQTRYVWDIFHVTMDYMQTLGRINDYLFMRSLHDYLTDNHIETALKRILITANPE
jgi:hypothetical protein